jgi:hypothetical protein
MATRKITLPTPSGIAFGSTALLQCPVGPAYRYRAIHLHLGVVATAGAALAATVLPTGSGTTAGFISDIRLKVNGKVQRLHTADQLAKLNAINGTLYAPSTFGASGTNTPGKQYGQVLTLHFAEPWRKSLGQADALAFPSGMVRSLEVEVDFGSTPTNAATAVFTAYAEVDSEAADPIHAKGPVISKVFRQNLTGVASAGHKVDVTWLDKRDLYTTIVADTGNGSRVGTAANGLTVATSGSYTAGLKVTANGVDVHEMPKGAAGLIHAAAGLNPNQFDLEAVLDSSDNILSGLQGDGLSDLRVTIDSKSDAPTGTGWILITERTGPID